MKKFQGYASVFHKIDAQCDIILPNSYFELKTNPKKMLNLPILWQHNKNKIIGKIANISEDKYGLLIRGCIDTNTTLGYDCYLKILQGICGISIGYQTIESHTENKIRYINKIELNEISIVTFPANQYARINWID